MAGHVYKPNCKCPKDKKCTCDATWAYIIDLGRKHPATGKKWPYKKGGFKKKTDAEAAMAKLIIDVQGGNHIKESAILFEDFASQWLKDYTVTHGVKKGTARIRQHEINRLLDYFQKIPLRDIKKKDYQAALNDLKLKGLAVNTISGIHSTGRMIFKLAAEWQYIRKENDPTEGARVPKDTLTIEQIENQNEIPKYLEKEQLALFLKTAKKYGLGDDYEVFYTLAYTGMRVGELCALAEKSLAEDEIKITRTIYNPVNNRKTYEVGTPKTKKSIRPISIEDDLANILKGIIAKNRKTKMLYRQTFHDKGFLFIFRDEEYAGYPLYPKLIDYRMKRILKLAGLDAKLSPHSLRHTHTSLLAEAGVSLEEIMDRLGHVNDDVTRRIYLHITKTKKKEASQKFHQLMQNLF